MKYEQPSVVTLGNATAVVLQLGLKPRVSTQDNSDPSSPFTSDAQAYAADE